MVCGRVAYGGSREYNNCLRVGCVYRAVARERHHPEIETLFQQQSGKLSGSLDDESGLCGISSHTRGELQEPMVPRKSKPRPPRDPAGARCHHRTIRPISDSCSVRWTCVHGTYRRPNSDGNHYVQLAKLSTTWVAVHSPQERGSWQWMPGTPGSQRELRHRETGNMKRITHQVETKS